jgi:hypothetical protein
MFEYTCADSFAYPLRVNIMAPFQPSYVDQTCVHHKPLYSYIASWFYIDFTSFPSYTTTTIIHSYILSKHMDAILLF